MSTLNDSLISIINYRNVILTKKPGQEYEDYVSAIIKNKSAVRVKTADMLSNLADTPTPKQIVRYAKTLLWFYRD